jgi:hypothetical protein
MNPEVQELIQRVLNNEMPIDVFYARMGQMGVLPSEAQTMLSKAAGGTPQGMDPSLPSGASQPVESSAYNYAPAQTATVMRDQYAPAPEGLMEKIQRGPLMRGVEIARAKIEGREPNFSAGNGPGPSLAGGASSPSYSSIQPAQIGPTGGMPSSAQTTPASSYVAQRFENSGSPYLGSPYRSDEGSPFEGFVASTEGSPYVGGPIVDRALTAARRTPRAEVASSQTTGAFMDPLTREMVGGSAPQQEQSGLAAFLRGRFGDAAKEDPNKLTAYQEARDRMGEAKASGGSVDAKPAKGDALHKALEIIHHLISTR